MQLTKLLKEIVNTERYPYINLLVEDRSILGEPGLLFIIFSTNLPYRLKRQKEHSVPHDLVSAALIMVHSHPRPPGAISRKATPARRTVPLLRSISLFT